MLMLMANLPDTEKQVIPNERSRLIDSPPSPAIVVDHQKLSDRLGTIVRAKEGKMVSVNARAPFTLHDAGPTASTNNANMNLNRRPPVLTMTPARSVHSVHSLNGNSDHSYSPMASGASSRASSRARPPRSVGANSHSTGSMPGSARDANGTGGFPRASEWFGENGSDLSINEEPVEGEPEPESLPTVMGPNSTPVAPRAPIAALSLSAPVAIEIDAPDSPFRPSAEPTPVPGVGAADDITFDWDS